MLTYYYHYDLWPMLPIVPSKITPLLLDVLSVALPAVNAEVTNCELQRNRRFWCNANIHGVYQGSLHILYFRHGSVKNLRHERVTSRIKAVNSTS